jgi:hypothetical protein
LLASWSDGSKLTRCGPKRVSRWLRTAACREGRAEGDEAVQSGFCPDSEAEDVFETAQEDLALAEGG